MVCYAIYFARSDKPGIAQNLGVSNPVAVHCMPLVQVSVSNLIISRNHNDQPEHPDVFVRCLW